MRKLVKKIPPPKKKKEAKKGRKEGKEGKGRIIPNKTSKSVSFICILAWQCHRTDRLFQPTQTRAAASATSWQSEAIGSSLGSGGVQLLMTAERAAPCRCDS